MSEVSQRNARNRRAGARWQSDLRDGLRMTGLDVERLVLAGSEDEGDLIVRVDPRIAPSRRYVVIEAKAGAMQPAQFVREAGIEAAHFAFHRGLDLTDVTGIAVIKRRGSNWKDAYVLTSLRDYFGLKAG